MSCTTACLCATVVVGVVAVLPWDRCCAARGTPPRADTPLERAIRDEMAPSLKPQLLEAASFTRTTTTTQNTGIIFTSLLLLFTALATVASGLEPVVSVAGVGTTAVAGLLLPGGVAAQSVDLLAALALHNTTRQGVSRTTGPQDLRPAYYLQGDYRDLRLPPNTFQRVVELLRTNPEFTFAAWLRQDETNSGSIVSFSHGNNRYLELQSSGRKDEIRLHYTSQHDATVHVETFPYRLADNAWHQLAVSVSGAQVELLVDCHPVYRRVLRLGAPDRNLTQAIPPLQLWVGQRNNRHSLFKGSLQDVRVIMGPHGYLAQCPHLNSTCPTCGQFSLLQSTVQELTRHLHELSERLVAAEGRIGRVEQCDCQKSCRLNGTAHGDGTTWKRDCDMCSCVHGEVECRPVQCPKITCKNPVINPGDCCPTCLKQCYLRGVLYDHGEQVALKQCVECECKDGSMQCKRINADTMCPKLQCPPEKQFSVPGECCKFCPDVDECKQEGGLEGHHCQSNTKCVNTPGSYVCECLTGYRRIDKFNCAELDECSTGEHGCDLHANCVNTQGSYHCVCQHGYTGDGYHCKPICNQTCLNGGECVSPNKCSCRKGYIGPSCELDLDECANGLHRCHPASVCVNMPGWYYCKCKHGYRSILRDNTLGTLCQDIDECKEGTHTCHPSARCINTDGGFRCTCTEDQAPGCKLSCMFEGNEVAHGQTVPPAGQPCRLCECNHGVITCQDPKCDCSVRGSETNKCCPQCDPNAVCTHQELRQVVFRSGERWIYQCQTCECLSGQVDCWDMDCPPLTCSDPVLTPGDCCPRCDNDPCSFDADDNSTSSGQPCTYAGRLYDSGTQWTDPDDRCTSCNCKVPFCAQLVSNVACCVHRTDVFAAVLISVVATLAARWGTMVWLLERAVYLPKSIKRPSQTVTPTTTTKTTTTTTTTEVAVPHQQAAQVVAWHWDWEWEWQWDVVSLIQQPQRNPIPIPISRRTQCLDTIARALLVSIIIVVRHCRTLIIIQNNIVQLYEWIVVLPMIVQCRRLRKVTLRHRTRLRRKQHTLIAINEQTQIQTPIIKTIEIQIIIITTRQQYQHQQETIAASRAVRPNRALVEHTTTNHTRLQHSTLETQVTHCDPCETFLMDICESFTQTNNVQ